MRRFCMWSLVGFAFLALLVPLPEQDARMVSLAMDLFHFPLMAGVAFLCFRALPGCRSSVLVGGLIVFQVVAECLQTLTGRDFSLMDMVLGCSGVLVVWGLCSSLKPWRKGLWIALCFLPAVFWGGGHARDHLQVPADFPLLSDFSNFFSSKRWETNGLEGRWKGEAGWLLTQTDPDQLYPGVTWNTMPHDWSGYSGIQIAWSDRSLPMMLRLDAAEEAVFEERWNFQFQGEGDSRTVLFDEDHLIDGRALPVNLSHIERMTLFFPTMETGATVQLQSIRLIR